MDASTRGDKDVLASGAMGMNLGNTREGTRLGGAMGDTMEDPGKLMMSLVYENSLFHR